MKVCHVVYSFYPFDPRVRKEVEALARAGHTVDVIAVQDEGEPRKEVVGSATVHRIPMAIVRGSRARYIFQYAFFMFLSAGLLIQLHLRKRYRVVHVHSLPDFLVFVAFPAKLLSASVVLDLHEAMPEILAARFRLPRPSALVRIARIAERMSTLCADYVLVPTELRRDLLVGRDVPANKVFVVMNSPDAAAVEALRANPPAAPTEPDGPCVLAYAGGINAERDLATLIRAASILSRSRAVTVFLFGKGDSAYRSELVRIAAEEAATVDLRIGDWVPPAEAFRYIRRSVVGVATYERNPLTEIAAPHKVMEYVAAGRPLVLADLKGLRHVWEGAALFYRPGDPVDLAARIEALIEDPELARRLVSRARTVYERLDWRHSEQVLLQVYARPGGGT